MDGGKESPEYRTRFAADLKKMLPRIPLTQEAKDFQAFSAAGRELAQWHLNYETVEPWPLVEHIDRLGETWPTETSFGGLVQSAFKDEKATPEARMNRFIVRWCSAALPKILISLILFATNLAKAEEAAELLPREASAWLNSPPLTTDALKGKGVVLWFFEETCPSCRGKWPGMYALAKRYEGQPVVFIAVNSGNSPAEVAQYAKEVKLTWPIIVDPSRQLEKRWLSSEISLQNIHQCELILPSGQKRPGQWNDLDATVKAALEGASWKIDPKSIPAAFLPTWQAVELGNYAGAANLLKKGLATRNAEVKEAATRVNDFVQGELRSAVEMAEKTRQEGDAWRAYQLYRGISTSFAGYDLPAEVASAQKELASDAKVKRQLEAAKALDLNQAYSLHLAA